MSDQQEFEKQNTHEVITLGETFYLLPPSLPMDAYAYREPTIDKQGYHRQITLDMQGLMPNILFPIGFRPATFIWINAITPLTPYMGYQFSADDYEEALRTEKILHVTPPQVPKSEKILYFSVHADEDENEKQGISSLNAGYGVKIPQEYRNILERLRLQVSFPYTLPDGTNGVVQLQAEPHSMGLDLGKVIFVGFYPIDFGPAVNPLENPRIEKVFWEKGAIPYFWGDFTLLQQATARFILLPFEVDTDMVN